jgi:hypothetical protein
MLSTVLAISKLMSGANGQRNDDEELLADGATFDKLA